MTDQSDLIPVTVAIPIKNEAAALSTCLAQLANFAEIVVIDSGSDDGSTKIAENFGARVIQFDWDGHFPKKRNWFLRNGSPTQEWVLFLDADEVVDADFCCELAEKIQTEHHHGFWLHYRTHFCNQELKFGIRQRKLALLRVGKAEYEHIQEHAWSRLDMEVHEQPIVEGSVGFIKRPVDHRNFKDLDAFKQRHVEYAQWEARRFYQINQGDFDWSRLTRRQRFKYRHLSKWWYPWAYFLGAYCFKGGLLDGRAGFDFAYHKSRYFHAIRRLIRLQRDQGGAT